MGKNNKDMQPKVLKKQRKAIDSAVPKKKAKKIKQNPAEIAETSSPAIVKKIKKQPKNVPERPPKKQEKRTQTKKAVKKNKKSEQSPKNQADASKPDVIQEESIEKIDNYNIYITEKLAKLETIKQKVLSKVQLDRKLITKAVKILLAHNEKTKNPKNILDTNEGFLYVEICFNKLPEHYSVRPIQITLPHPIYSEEYQSKFAIIVRDPQREFKDKIQDFNIPLIAKVIGYSKISKKYPTYEDKRKLCNSFDYFFCDYKIYDLLRKPTGKFFYSRKKIPFPIDLDAVPKHLSSQFQGYDEYLNDLGKHAYFMMGNGPVYTFKTARVSMTLDQIIENIIAGIQNILPWILDMGLKIKYIEHIDIKLFNSVSLPIFNYLSKKDIKAYLS